MGRFKNKLNDLQSSFFFFLKSWGSLLLLLPFFKILFFCLRVPATSTLTVSLQTSPRRRRSSQAGIGSSEKICQQPASSPILLTGFLFVFGKTEAWKLSSEIVAYYLHQSSGTAEREREREWEIFMKASLLPWREKKKHVGSQKKNQKKEKEKTKVRRCSRCFHVCWRTVNVSFSHLCLLRRQTSHDALDLSSYMFATKNSLAIKSTLMCIIFCNVDLWD